MKYLFFDIECAGVFKNVAKISNFCLGNEKSNGIFSGDINVEYDSLNADGTLFLGVLQNYGGYKTTYNGNLNLKIKNTKT